MVTKKALISDDLRQFLIENEFIYLATSDANQQPYAVPKFLIHVDGENIYLADYVRGTTFKNLRCNPKVSISSIDLETLNAYQLNGVAEILESGSEFNFIMEELDKKKTHFSVNRVIQGVQTGKKHENFELGFPSELAIVKITAREVIQVDPAGKVKKIS